MNARVTMILSFTPWLLFGVIIGWMGPGAAGLAAALAGAVAAALLLHNRGRSGVTIVDAAGAATFGVLAVCGLVGGSAADQWIAGFGRAAVTFLLAAVMLVSAVTVPFSEQYARRSVPSSYWHSPVFRAVNRKISALWGAVVALTGCAHLVAGALNPVSGPRAVPASGHVLLNLVLNWVLPIALTVFAAKQTQRISTQARTSANQISRPGDGGTGNGAATTAAPFDATLPGVAFPHPLAEHNTHPGAIGKARK